MGADEHGGAARLELPEDLLELLDGVGVQAHQGLIEDDHPGFVGQGAADGKLLLHALGKLLAQLVFFIPQLHPFQQLPGVGFVLHAVGAADELQMLRYGQQVVHGWHFRNIAQLALGLLGGVFKAVYLNAAGKAKQAGNALDNGGFSRAVGAQQDADLPVSHGKADVVVGHHLAVFFSHSTDGTHVGSPFKIEYSSS